ncbi:SPOR domain-containing protein [Vibrio sp. AK197]
MKKIAIVGLSALLSACVSSDYVTDVTSESYQEDYQTADSTIEQPVVSSQGTADGISEQNVEPTVVAMSPKSDTINVKKEPKPAVAISAPSEKQVAMNPRFGYTIQVVAVGSQAKVDRFAKKLPANGQPIWENYKVINGTKWYTVLFGDYASRTEAKKAISQLPEEFQSLKPFVKSIDKIKNSEFPALNKLN